VELGRAIRPGLVHDFTTGVHGEHDVRLLRPVRPNMAVQWQSTLYGLRQTKAGVMLVQSVLVSDDGGTVLVEHLWSNFYPGARIDAEQGELKPAHTFPEDARSRPAGTRAVPVDRDQTFRYAGISGDHVPHAMDDEAARKEGFPGKILQGLCTLGICSGAVVDVAAERDPRRLRRLAARFAAPALPDHDLVVEVYDNGETADGARSFAFEASQDGMVVIRHGRAEVTAD
jgi:acyl dehydratase